jgi:hypothetical protein
MKKLTLILIALLLAGLLLGGCVADKKPDPPARREGPPPMLAPALPAPSEDSKMVAAMQAEHQQTLRLALKTNPNSALTVPISSVPPIPKGFRSPWEQLTMLTVIASSCGAGAEQCISPSLPAAAAGQRAEGVDSREAGNEADAGAGAGEGVVNKPEESAAATPPPADVRLLAPAK